MKSYIKLFIFIYIFYLNIYINHASSILKSSSSSSSSSYPLSPASISSLSAHVTVEQSKDPDDDDDLLDNFEFENFNNNSDEIIDNESSLLSSSSSISFDNLSKENYDLTSNENVVGGNENIMQQQEQQQQKQEQQINQRIDNIDNIDLDDIDIIDDDVEGNNEESSSTLNEIIPIKKKMIKNAVTKSLTHKKLSQKFVEVIPILRVLSSQQKIALSSLITAQISAKPGTELKLSQVRSLFGDNQKLILPLVLDIANMVRNAAKSTLSSDNYDSSEFQSKKKDKTTVKTPIMKTTKVTPPPPTSTTTRTTKTPIQEITSTSSTNLPPPLPTLPTIPSVPSEDDNSSNYHRRVYDQSANKSNRFDMDVDDENIEEEEETYYGEIMDPIIINNELYDAYGVPRSPNTTSSMGLIPDQ